MRAHHRTRLGAQRGDDTARALRARFLPTHVYPTPQAQRSNQLHLIDLVGPIYLKGQRQRYYIFVCRDAFDGAVGLKLSRSRQMEAVLVFLGECWKTLGRPEQIQFDNAREFLGWGPAARYLSRVIRLCLRFGIEPIFIPPAQPQRNGAVEWFNGWFQPRLLQRHYTCAGALKRELQRLQDTVNTQHVRRRLACDRSIFGTVFQVSPQDCDLVGQPTWLPHIAVVPDWFRRDSPHGLEFYQIPNGHAAWVA